MAMRGSVAARSGSGRIGAGTDGGATRGRRRDDTDAVAAARADVDAAKHGLGERGPVWWHDGSPDYNRHMAVNTPYATWFAGISPSI
jgi:hypothetical protein